MWGNIWLIVQVLDCELAMKITSYDDDEEDDDAEDPEDDAEEERTCLAEAIDSLLDVKPELTPAWAESVRQILRSTDMSSSASSGSSSGSADPASHTPARWHHDKHHDKVVAGLEGWCLSHSCFSCPFSATIWRFLILFFSCALSQPTPFGGWENYSSLVFKEAQGTTTNKELLHLWFWWKLDQEFLLSAWSIDEMVFCCFPCRWTTCVENSSQSVKFPSLPNSKPSVGPQRYERSTIVVAVGICSPVTGQPCFTLKESQSSRQMGCCWQPAQKFTTCIALEL